jgi:hypothetical protein
LQRFDLSELLLLIGQKKYFALHAPRQTGKTSALLALRDHLNSGTSYRCVYINVEVGQSAREDVAAAMQAILGSLASAARATLGDKLIDSLWPEVLSKQGPHGALKEMLSLWAAADAKPAVLLIDEIDALIGDTLISVLRQLRAGYIQRPQHFPQNIILCGVRDVRDYRIHSSGTREIITGGSAFNVKAESLRLGNFIRPEIEALYHQHTDETGQPFEADALARVWWLTEGQPWLVNALGYETCFKMKAGRERSRPVTRKMIDQAKENLIEQRQTHLDQLTDKLREPRVRRVIEPIMAGGALGDVPPDDIDYVIDLGLCTLQPDGGLQIANPIYREVLPRVLSSTARASLPMIAPTWLSADGNLDTRKLLEAFLTFWRRHGQPLLQTAHYHEIAPHIVLMAFLDRVVNGGGTLEREYAIGSDRMDLHLRYGDVQLAIELKVWRDRRPDPLPQGLEQLDAYLAGLGLDGGWLVIFDQRSGLPDIAERTATEQAQTPGGRAVTVIRA